MQQLRMPPHERQWSTTLLALSRSRTPPSWSQHIDCCTLEDCVAAGISLLGRGCGALGAERGNKTSERVVSTFCPLLDPPRFRTSPPPSRHLPVHPLTSRVVLAEQKSRVKRTLRHYPKSDSDKPPVPSSPSYSTVPMSNERARDLLRCELASHHFGRAALAASAVVAEHEGGQREHA